MAKERLCPTGMLKPRGSYSQVEIVVRVADIQVEGKVIGIGDIRAQTRQVLQNIKRGMEAVGGTLKDVVSLTVFTTDARYNSEVSEVRREIFDSDLPASTQVEVAGLMRPELLIEISAVAILSTKA